MPQIIKSMTLVHKLVLNLRTSLYIKCVNLKSLNVVATLRSAYNNYTRDYQTPVGYYGDSNVGAQDRCVHKWGKIYHNYSAPNSVVQPSALLHCFQTWFQVSWKRLYTSTLTGNYGYIAHNLLSLVRMVMDLWQTSHYPINLSSPQPHPCLSMTKACC